MKLDPDEWEEFRAIAHELLDACIDRLENAALHPWKPVPIDQVSKFKLSGQAKGYATVARRLAQEIMPYSTGNTHPSFFGWVHGSGLASGILSEMVSATMNSNAGGRDHGINYIERAVIEWSLNIMGFPSSGSGVLVTGTSQATVLALAAARQKKCPNVRQDGISSKQLTIYAGEGVHTATVKAIELLGLGRKALRLVPSGRNGIDLSSLKKKITKDFEAGYLPMAIVGTAGSVDLGRFDDLLSLAEISEDHNIWLHIDGAFGAWTRLADDPWHALTDGISLADSIACDFHKWMYIPYDCGMVLMRDEKSHRGTFSSRPDYLASQNRGLGGGDPWYCEYGIDLSRSARALKVWTAIETYGESGLGASITANCNAAAFMAELIERDVKMALVAPVVSNVCAFTADATLTVDQQSSLNKEIAIRLQMSGDAVFSTTVQNNCTILRAAITNHRTNMDTVKSCIESVIRIRKAVHHYKTRGDI